MTVLLEYFNLFAARRQKSLEGFQPLLQVATPMHIIYFLCYYYYYYCFVLHFFLCFRRFVFMYVHGFRFLDCDKIEIVLGACSPAKLCLD